MKTILIMLLSVIAASAVDLYDDGDGRLYFRNGNTNVYLTAQEIADRASEIVLQAAMPAQFPSGVAVPIPDEAGHWMLIQPTANGEPVIGLQISDSPIDPAAWKARKASAVESNNTARAEIAVNLRTARSNMVVNITDCQAITATNFPAGGQRQTITDLRRELIDLAQEVQRLRKIVATMNRKE